MPRIATLTSALAVLAIAAFCFGTAFAEDTTPAAKPVEKKVEDTAAPTTEALPEVATKTETPLCSMMSWIGAQIKADAGEDCKCCGEAMKKWFTGGANVPLAGMRDQLVADGWTADSTIAFFQKMQAERAAKGEGCKDCAGAKGDCDCGGDCPCDKAGDCEGCPCEKAAKEAARKAAEETAAPKKDAKP